ITSELGIKIELSGGLRDAASLDEALEMGATRVNLGTAALENPAWTAQVIEKYGDKIAVGLDVRGEKLATRGWVEEGGNIWDVLEQLEEAGCARYVVTDITKDGTLTGPNTDLLVEIAEKTGKPVIASGGISTLDDIAKLTGMVDRGIEGAIIGKALYAGQFTLHQALQVANGSAVKDV
ncbi:MAG: HisA/HisF-related TIM barrel protein, partial [Yaniella sp.]|nr:HisA/HisF-related TIM barrel protein [Yaniella sp.]